MPSSDTQFKKGQSGNPAGRKPKYKAISEIILMVGEEAGTAAGDKDKMEVVIRKVFEHAVQGKAWAVQFIADRLEGKARQAIDMTTTTTEQSPFAEMSVDELRAFKDSLTRDK